MEGEREVVGDDSKCSSDKPMDCDTTTTTIILSPQVKVEAFSSRNQFDRSSQLRRSKKKRRKSDAGPGNSSLLSGGGREESSVLSTSRAEYSSNYGNLI